MLDSAQILTNVCDINNFDIVNTRELLEGSFPVDFHIRLFQKDLDIRYSPDSTATVSISFLRMDSIAEESTDQTLTLGMSKPFADDRSIWVATISDEDSLDLIVSGGFRLTILESGVQTKIFNNSSSIRKVLSAQTSGAP